MRRLILLEDLPDSFEANERDSIVALTPRACYLMSRRQQPYHIVSDFASEAELAILEETYWEEELAWFDQLDDLLWEEIPELQERKIRPASLYGYFLKICLDNLFIRGFEITALLKEEYDEVVLWRSEVTEPPLDPTLFYRGPGVYSRLLPLFCHQFGIEYKEQLLSPSPVIREERQGAAKQGVKPVKAMLRWGRRAAVGLYKFSRTKLWAYTHVLGRFSARQRPLTLLFLQTGYDLGHLLKAAKRSGHRCLLKVDNRVVDVSTFPSKTMATLWNGTPNSGDSGTERTSTGWTEVAKKLFDEESAIWGWPNGWYGVPVSQVLAPRFKYWTTDVLPDLVGQADQFLRIYQDYHVDFVVAPHIADLSICAAVAATQATDFTQAIHLEHGDSLFAAKVWDLLNLFHFDHYFATHRDFAKYFRERRTRYARPMAQIHVGSYRWRANSALAHSPRVTLGTPPDNVSSARPIVLYLLTATGWDARYLNNAWYSDTWHYQLQTRIIDSFIGRTEHTFVVKLFPGEPLQPPHTPSFISEYISDLAQENIVTSRLPFRQWLPWVDRVIIDFPATGLYEAAVAGVPFHILLYAGFKVREAALERFRPWITVFEQPEEAVEAVDRFLRTEVERRPVLQPEGEDILATLEGLAEIC